MPMAMLSGNGEELRRILLENGLTYISTRPALRSLLCEYISRSLPGRRVTCVEKTGWHCGVYVLPDEVISFRWQQCHPSGQPLSDWRLCAGH